MKIVINNKHGGFGLSRDAFLMLRELGEITSLNEPDFGEYWNDASGPRENHGLSKFCSQIPRDSQLLIKVIEDMGEKANGTLSSLKIVEIPDNVDWQIEEYDGLEWVAEKHRTWQ